MLAITETPAWSPSHTVGSEQKDKGFVKVFHAFIKSPSHAVGLELLTEPWHRVVVCKSPSHTVGLEQLQIRQLSVAELMSPSHTVGSEPKK